MNKETFGVELELITSKFNQKIQQVKSSVSDFSDSLKSSLGVGKYANDINALQDKIDNLQKQLEKNPGNIGLQNVLKSFNNQLEKAKQKQIELNDTTTKMSSSFKNTFQDGVKQVKRFSLALFGIQSIWRMVSRASSSYLSQDVELSEKLQAVWIGLGSMLAPILEKMANFFLKLVTYFNAFIQGLTGVNLLAKAMDKANSKTKATTGSVKALKGQLSGMDELNNIADSDSGGGGSVDTNWADAFNNVSVDLEWIDRLKDFGAWFRDNWVVVVALLTGTVTAINLIKLGVGGVMALGIGLALAGVIIAIDGIIKMIKDPSWDNFAQILEGIGLLIAGIGVITGGIPAIVIGVVVAVAGVIIKYRDEIWNALKVAWNWITETFSKIGAKFSEWFGTAKNAVVKVFDNVVSYLSGVWNKIKEIFSKVGNTIADAISGAVKGAINGLFTIIENLINNFVKSLNKAVNIINKIPGVNIGLLDKISIPRLATGTNYVPQDTMAVIHKGEAVIPKKFNEQEYFGGSEETQNLIRQLIEVVENKDTGTYLDGKLIGSTAINYINTQSRYLGKSLI